MATSEVTAGSTAAARVGVREVAVGLYDHYESIAEVKAYYGVLAIYALARTAADAADSELLARVERILRRFPDEIDHPPYNFPSYRIGGIAQSFMIAQGRMQDRKDLLQEYADELMSAQRDRNGILTMINQPGDKIWIDVAMAASPFLLFAGRALNRPDYVDEAINQTVLMYDELLDRDLGLLHQCKNFVAPGVVSSDHWGRGNGWGLFALAELVRGLPADASRRGEVEERFLALATHLLPYQSDKGLWRQEIPMASAWEESSGTGLIIYGLGIGVRSGLLGGSRWIDAIQSGITGLAKFCINQDYSTENSCPGTLCPGEGEERGTPEAYVRLRTPTRDEPHSFGALMLALTAARDSGITDLELRRWPQTTLHLTSESR